MSEPGAQRAMRDSERSIGCRHALVVRPRRFSLTKSHRDATSRDKDSFILRFSSAVQSKNDGSERSRGALPTPTPALELQTFGYLKPKTCQRYVSRRQHIATAAARRDAI